MKIFKNRMTQEDKKTLNKLKGTYINMNYDKPTSPDTPDGLFFVSLQPNNYVDEIKLEKDFNYILCLYYRWRYGSKWTKLKHLQHKYQGIIEKQRGNHNHIHFILGEYDIVEVAMFLGYIKQMFKELYPKSSTNFQRVYDIKNCDEYVAINNQHKGRVAPVVQIGNNMSLLG